VTTLRPSSVMKMPKVEAIFFRICSGLILSRWVSPFTRTSSMRESEKVRSLRGGHLRTLSRLNLKAYQRGSARLALKVAKHGRLG